MPWGYALRSYCVGGTKYAVGIPNILGYLAPPTVTPARLRARAASLRSTAPVFISKLHLIFITRRKYAVGIRSTLVLCRGANYPKGVPNILRIISMGVPDILGYLERGCRKVGVPNIL